MPPLLRAFRPELLVTQHGCDSHALDPLAHLPLSVDGQRAAYAALHALAHEHADGRWVALGGGGYAHVEVVPRAWAHLVGEVVARPGPAAVRGAGELAGVRAGPPRSHRSGADDRRRRPAGTTMVGGPGRSATGRRRRGDRGDPARRPSGCTGWTLRRAVTRWSHTVARPDGRVRPSAEAAQLGSHCTTPRGLTTIGRHSA